MEYGMVLDVRDAMLDPSSPEVSEYRVVSIIAAQTSWKKIRGSDDYESTGHFVAVCSSREEPEQSEPQWFMCDDNKVTMMEADRVLRFGGAAGDEQCGRGRNGSNKVYAELFLFVRADCVDKYYAGVLE
jgi:hypothetical protein